MGCVTDPGDQPLPGLSMFYSWEGYRLRISHPDKEIALDGPLHGSEPLSNLGVSYSKGRLSGGGATGSIPGDVVAPGQTVPFRKYGNLDPDVTAVTVLNVSSNVGEIDIDVTVTR